MKHRMSLQPGPFSRIKDGTKTIEVRLYDKKRKAIKVGDEIEFVIADGDMIGDKTILKKVKALHVYSTFAELFRALGKEKSGHQNDSDAVSTMRKYYNEVDEIECGVVGIELT